MTLIAVALALLTDATPYPIPPHPLRWLYRDAELVVVATPGKTTELKGEENFWDCSVVTLTIRRTLKGKAEGNQVTVRYSETMVCPAPPDYPEGKTVLAFLRRDLKLKAYTTVALSYGTKVLNEESLKAYLQRLEELEKIPAEKKSDAPSDATIDWLVRCIEQPATRWEGAFEFAPTNSVARIDDRDEWKPIPLTRITKDQWARIIDRFVATASRSHGDAAVLNLLGGIPSLRIDAFLVEQIKGELARKELDWTGRLMGLLASRLDLQDAKEILNAYQNAADEPAKLDQVRRFLHLAEKADR